MQGDRRGIRYVQALHVPGRGDAAERVAALPRQMAETLSFCPKHERKRQAEFGLNQRLRRFFCEAEPPIAGLAKLVKRLGEVAGKDNRHDLERAACGFGERPGERRAVPRRHHEAR